jgi:hypothetical protein
VYSLYNVLRWGRWEGMRKQLVEFTNKTSGAGGEKKNRLCGAGC